jgi:hypothetical protein
MPKERSEKSCLDENDLVSARVDKSWAINLKNGSFSQNKKSKIALQ